VLADHEKFFAKELSDLPITKISPPVRPEVASAVSNSMARVSQQTKAGVLLRTSTRPTLNLLLLLRASVRAFTLTVCHAAISIRVLVLHDPPPIWKEDY